jgi:hypothetical protein
MKGDHKFAKRMHLIWIEFCDEQMLYGKRLVTHMSNSLFILRLPLVGQKDNL